MLQGSDCCVRVDHAFGLTLWRLRLVPETAAVLPDEGIDLDDGVVVGLGSRVRNSVEIVVKGLTR